MTCSNLERLRLFGRMFSRPVFAQIAKTGEWEAALRFLASQKLLKRGPTQTVGGLFESAWVELRRSYRNEYVYKAELTNRLIFGRHSPRTAALHVEMPVANSIADLVVVNGTSTAYEIKTEFDSPRRLQTQTTDYLKVFDRVFVVADPDLALAYAAAVDERVGVLSLNKRGSLSQLRAAASNAASVDAKSIFRCLHRAEYVAAVEAATGQQFNFPNGIIASKCQDVFCDFSPLEAHRILVNSLRSRKTDISTATFVSRLPECVRVLGYATPLSGRQRETAVAVFERETSVAIA